MALVPDMDSFSMDSYSEHDGDFYGGFSYENKITDSFSWDSSCGGCSSGMRLEMATKVDSGYSFRKAVVLVVAVDKLKKGLRSHTGFRDTDLLTLLGDIFVQEEVSVRDVESDFSVNQQYSWRKLTECNVRDSDNKCLAVQQSIGSAKLVAVHLQGANSQREEKIGMSLYASHKSNKSDKRPVTLGLIGKNLYLSCSLVDGEPQLHLETVNDIKKVENSELLRFIFWKPVNGDTFSFESEAFPGWYISTSQAENELIRMKPEDDQTYLRDFKIFF